MIWSLILNNRIIRALGAVLMAISAFFAYGAMKKREGRKDAAQEARNNDSKRAKEIRDRVRNDDGSLHDYSDRGFRD